MYKFTGFRESFFMDRKVRVTQPKFFNDPFETAINSSLLSGIWLNELKNYGLGDEDFLINHLRHNSEVDPSIGILSLTKSPNNLLMWAHYANEHKGIVVEVDVNHSFFNSKSSGFSGKCFEIQYTNERRETTDYLKNESGLPPRALLKKSTEWSYEKEVRFFLTKGYVEVSATSPDVWLCQLPKDVIKSIIVGVRSNKWHVIYHFFKAVLTGTLSEDTKLYLSRIKNDVYEIEYVPFCNFEEICKIIYRGEVKTLLLQLKYIQSEPLEKLQRINGKYAETIRYMLND